MRIVWIVNHYMPEVTSVLKINAPMSGTWLIKLARLIAKNHELTIVCCYGNRNKTIVVGNIRYELIKTTSYDKFISPTVEFKKNIRNVLSAIKPNIIHIHGTEFAFFKCIYLEKYPLVTSIQGLVSEVVKYTNLSIFFSEKKYPLVFIYELLKKIINKQRAKAEIEQLNLMKNVLGRTEWDRAHSMLMTPKKEYYFLQETLRDKFFEKKWSLDGAKKCSIFLAGGNNSIIKGAHFAVVLLELLEPFFNDVEVKIVGENIFENPPKFGYKKFLYNEIKRKGLNFRIRCLGSLSEEEMIQEFKSAHVYVMTSLIENSSNTLGEAMVLGVPTVASYVGGTSSLVSSNEALFYRAGDAHDMAWQIKKIFENDNLAISLSQKLIQNSQQMYNSNFAISELEKIYNNVIGRDLDGQGFNKHYSSNL